MARTQQANRQYPDFCPIVALAAGEIGTVNVGWLERGVILPEQGPGYEAQLTDWIRQRIRCR